MTSFSLGTTSKHPRFDTIIGLDVGGTLYYCRKSTLLGISEQNSTTSYFAARFGPDSMMDPLRDRLDDHGREIYFIDRNPHVFQYVLEYLRIHKLPPQIGSFYQHPELWRALRAEAEFYSLDRLSALLQTTYTCSPNLDGGKGILYWLGTNRGTETYINPHRRQVIDITGWFDSQHHPPQQEQQYTMSQNYDAPTSSTIITSSSTSNETYWGSSDRKENLVQYRPLPHKCNTQPPRSSDMNWQRYRMGVGNISFRTLTTCRQSNLRCPIIIIDLRKIQVCPTHYSLRYGSCRGMDGKWNFEGSNDGMQWTVLHCGMDNRHRCRATRISDQQAQFEARWFDTLLRSSSSCCSGGIGGGGGGGGSGGSSTIPTNTTSEEDETKNEKYCWKELYCDYMEKHYRHIWEIEYEDPFALQQQQQQQQQQNRLPTQPHPTTKPRPSQYFQFFRIIGNDPQDGEGRCLHFIGLEIYGHVFEE